LGSSDLTNLPEKNLVSLINTVPSAAKILLQDMAIPSNVSVINLAGEALGLNIINALFKLTNVQDVYNLYGPSECTTYATYKKYSEIQTNAPNIGLPVNNTRVYILDGDKNFVPKGAIGELYIAGDSTSPGYYTARNNDQFTSLKNEYVKEPLIYKTGDLVKFTDNWEISYIGRVDNQVKVRGYRIEIPEVEKVISSHPGVKDLVITVKKSGNTNDTLIAYVIAHNDLKQADLSNYVREILPTYMLPHYYEFINEFPLTPNGKIDHKLLPMPTLNNKIAKLKVDFATTTEEAIKITWESLLNNKNIGTNENFFDLGGTSFIIIEMLRLIKAEMRITLQLSDIFKYPNIQMLAGYIDSVKTSIVTNNDNKVAKINIKKNIPTIQPIKRRG